MSVQTNRCRDAPPPHLGGELVRRRQVDELPGERARAHDLAAEDVPDPPVDHLAVEPLAGQAGQQALEVHVEGRRRRPPHRIAVHVAMRADFDEHEAAIARGDAVDERRIERAEVGHVAHGLERRRHVKRDSTAAIAIATERASGVTQHEPCHRRRHEQRQHVLDAVEHRAGRRRVEPEERLRQDRARGVEADARRPAGYRDITSIGSSQTFARLR